MTKDEVLAYMLNHYVPKSSSATWLPNRKPTYGISYPKLKEISKIIIKSDPITFLETNDFSLYELEILQTYVIGALKDINQALHYFKSFLDNAKEWSLIDSLCQKFIITKKYPNEVFEMLKSYKNSNDEFIERMISVMILSHFMIDDYIEDAIKLIDTLNHQGYYAKMGKAWMIAEYMIKYPEQAMLYLKQNNLDTWTHNKAIQKMIESYRIPNDLKEALKLMRIK